MQIDGNEALNATAQRGGEVVADLLSRLGMRDAEMAALSREIAALQQKIAELEKPAVAGDSEKE